MELLWSSIVATDNPARPAARAQRATSTHIVLLFNDEVNTDQTDHVLSGIARRAHRGLHGRSIPGGGDGAANPPRGLGVGRPPSSPPHPRPPHHPTRRRHARPRCSRSRRWSGELRPGHRRTRRGGVVLRTGAVVLARESPRPGVDRGGCSIRGIRTDDNERWRRRDSGAGVGDRHGRVDPARGEASTSFLFVCETTRRSSMMKKRRLRPFLFGFVRRPSTPLFLLNSTHLPFFAIDSPPPPPSAT